MRLQKPLSPGSIVNEGVMMIPKTYLDEYVMAFDQEDPPIIARLTYQNFKDSL